jgi:riboflavin kinase/FMN adenylyltransferase
MNVFHGNKIEFDKNTVLTVGSFDGIHRGHRLILDHLATLSNESKLRSMLVTFEPHPQLVLKNKSKEPLKILTTLDEKIEILKQIGIDNLWVIKFDKEFSNTSAHDFVVEYLVKKSGLSKFLIGYDHMFGKNREGDENLLKELSPKYSFEIEKLDSFELNNTVVSSTKIRNAIKEADISTANKMLGRNFNVMGTVVHGKKRGNQIGYPTANIVPDNENKVIPPIGAYVVKSIIDNKEVYGMCNIGIRPTFGDLDKEILETHFFDLDTDLYGKVLNIEFLTYIREEKKFSILDELVFQLDNDKTFSLDFLKNTNF